MNEFLTSILLSAIFTLLFIIAKDVETDRNEIKDLLKEIRNNTKDKTKLVKPVNISANAETTKRAYCPICGRSVHSYEKYCDSCGTGLDWSDTE